MMSSKPVPPPNGMPSFWRSSVGHLDNFRSTESLPTECDILIIGAGYSGGALLTHMISEDESIGKRILVLEARQLCSGATGRNGTKHPPCNSYSGMRSVEKARTLTECLLIDYILGGHLKPDVYNLASKISERLGVEAAAEIADFEMANVNAVKNYIQEAGVDCDFTLTQAVDVQLSERHNSSLKSRYDKFIAAGAASAQEATYHEGKDAEEVYLQAPRTQLPEEAVDLTLNFLS